MRADAELARIQRGQFGVFGAEQAVRAGVSRKAVEGRAARGRYQRLLPGVFMEAGTPDTWESRAMACQLHVRGDALLARFTAARIHGLEVRAPDDQFRLLAHTRSRIPAPARAYVLHRSASYDAALDQARHGAFRLTSPERTCVDLAGELAPTQLRRLVAQALRLRLATGGDLRACLARVGRVAGATALRQLLDEISPLHRDCRSELESRFLAVMVDAGLPPTAMNHPVVDAEGNRRVLDAIYLPQRQPIELDSQLAHGSSLDRLDDVRRENAIVLTGHRPFLRFTWHDVTQRPYEMVRLIREALATRPTPPSPTPTNPSLVCPPTSQ